MKQDDFNNQAFEHNKKIVDFNKHIKIEFEKYGGIELLTQYVMSETIAPIEDYENVVKIIRANYHRQLSCELMIIGAYLSIGWDSKTNELLKILNLMYDFMPEKERAIINYLNAYNIYMNEDNYFINKKYRYELIKSLNYNTPFVNNRSLMAKLLDKNEAHKYYESAIENVIEISSKIDKMELEYYLDPQSFINEFILGTHISNVMYNTLQEKLFE